MSNPLRLPHALLDFTLARATARLHALNSRSLGTLPIRRWRRYGHSAVAAVPNESHLSYFPEPSEENIIDDGSLYARRKRSQKNDLVAAQKPSAAKGPLSELEERVLQLQEIVESEEALAETPTYSESELLAIYEDLLALPTNDAHASGEVAPIDEWARDRQDALLMHGVAERLLEKPEEKQPPAETFYEHAAILNYLQKVADVMDVIRIVPPDSKDAPKVLPTGLLTNNEWSALIRTCIRANNGEAAETTLQLMKRTGAQVLEEHANEVLAMYASAGDVPNTERFLHTFVSGSLSNQQRDLHVKAHVKASPPGVIPTEALSLLHAYEARNTPAPQKTYTRLIVALLQSRSASSQAYAHAWDLFAHMRYAAHPTPDAALYTLMISACSAPNGPAQPERALDLFTEMTVDQSIPPTAHAYSAAILVCARSGEVKFVHEAFRLAKEMLDAHRDARGRSAFRPDGRLFSALLEGAKRVGDLPRVRWILAEMVRDSAEGDLNEQIMTHVLHAYAAYKPPFRRAATVIVDKKPAPPSERSQEAPPTVQGVQEAAHAETDSLGAPTPQHIPAGTLGPEYDEVLASLPVEASTPSFAHIPPQSREEVVREARILFRRIVEDNNFANETREGAADQSNLHQAADTRDGSPLPKFRHVRLTSRLLNAYLSVHYVHAPFEDWSELYRTLFAELGVPRNGRTYVEVLERCTRSKGQERRMALKFAEEVWVGWQDVENGWRTGQMSEGDPSQTLDARLVERANIAMIRLLSLVRETGRALDLVRSFAERYPPGALRATRPKPAIFSTRTVLHAARPLVRLTSSVDITDDRVPPLFSFTDVEILHHRLVAVGDTAGIRYLKWLCHAYDGALRRRREAAMHAVPEGSRSDVRLNVEEDDSLDQQHSYRSV